MRQLLKRVWLWLLLVALAILPVAVYWAISFRNKTGQPATDNPLIEARKDRLPKDRMKEVRQVIWEDFWSRLPKEVPDQPVIKAGGSIPHERHNDELEDAERLRRRFGHVPDPIF